ncbi:hypothetical protein MLD38_013905 [Melastoma candidum]|uniref:Uncharacterized protein n=1 Tax=Melastoma candidum TaxID=119954 RepID=A0ACB9RF91_9MYRT|nr:hypothetical protein MLD38_013905 [Melastoma candidum]
MLATLNACAQERGIPGGAEFFESDVGSWNDQYREFFLDWYYRSLIFHGERIFREAETIFRGVEVCMSAKLAALPYSYDSPHELTSGYLNTLLTVNFLWITRLLGQYGFGLCCTWIELLDRETIQMHAAEAIFKPLVFAARLCDVLVEGQSMVTNFQEASFERIVRMSKYYSWDGLGKHSASFNVVRMDKRMLEYGNWVRFTRFVRQMSVASIFRARQGAADIISSSVDVARTGLACGYC